MVPQKGLSRPESPLAAVLTGPTAAGKTALALDLARARPGRIEIVNADSMLVYRGMDIGTAKPTRAELDEVPHHLIDIREPDEPFTAADFVRAVDAALDEIHSRGKRALIVGGTGFYLRALFYGLWEAPAGAPALRAELEALPASELYGRLERVDAASALRIGVADRYRLVRALELVELSGKTPTQLQAEVRQDPDPRFELWIADREPRELERRIELRCEQMLQDGLLDEVRRIRERHPHARALGAVGYHEACAYLDGVAPRGRKARPGEAGLRDEIILSTRQLVKRQRTWFRNLHGRLGEASHWFTLPGEEWRPRFERVYG